MRHNHSRLLRRMLFQSTPPVAGGRCERVQPCHRHLGHVSIHAPRCRGAMPCPLAHRNHCVSGFNPRPPLPGGDAGRTRRRYLHRRSFNPRPPLPGGDALPAGNSFYFPPVSIHAPRCRGAMPGGKASSAGALPSFNPRPPLPGGDARHHHLCEPRIMFQSTPPVAGGRCPAK